MLELRNGQIIDKDVEDVGFLAAGAVFWYQETDKEDHYIYINLNLINTFETHTI